MSKSRFNTSSLRPLKRRNQYSSYELVVLSLCTLSYMASSFITGITEIKRKISRSASSSSSQRHTKGNNAYVYNARVRCEKSLYTSHKSVRMILFISKRFRSQYRLAMATGQVTGFYPIPKPISPNRTFSCRSKIFS